MNVKHNKWWQLLLFSTKDCHFRMSTHTRVRLSFLYVMCIQERLRVGLRRLSALPCMGQYKFLFYFFAHNSSHFQRLTGIYGEGCGSDDSVSNAVLGHTLVLGVVLARLGRFDPQYRHRRLGDNHVAGWLGRHLQDRLKRGSLSFHNTTRKANFSLMGHKPPNFSFTHWGKKEGSFRLLLETKGSTFFLLIKLKPMSSYTRSRSKTLSRIVNILWNARWSWEAEKKMSRSAIQYWTSKGSLYYTTKGNGKPFHGSAAMRSIRKTLHSHRIDDTYKKREREKISRSCSAIWVESLLNHGGVTTVVVVTLVTNLSSRWGTNE